MQNLILRIVAALATLTMATGCSIMHPVADDYGQYLKQNTGTTKFQPATTASQYYLAPATEQHHYEFRSATVGYAHVWVVEFGKVLDATMQSKDVIDALGTLSKAKAGTGGPGPNLGFDLQNYTFEDHGAHVGLTISIRGAQGDTFKKTYKADGQTQGGKMFWAGAFGMKNAVQQSTKLALDEIIASFLADLKTQRVQTAAK